MKTGLPSQKAVICWPGDTAPTSTWIELSASTSALGFICATSGQTAAPTVTAPAAPVATYRKSRRLALSTSSDTGHLLRVIHTGLARAQDMSHMPAATGKLPVE